MEFVQRYSLENDAPTVEGSQAIIKLLHGAMGELELAELPRRGAWGSVTAKKFPEVRIPSESDQRSDGEPIAIPT